MLKQGEKRQGALAQVAAELAQRARPVVALAHAAGQRGPRSEQREVRARLTLGRAALPAQFAATRRRTVARPRDRVALPAVLAQANVARRAAGLGAGRRATAPRTPEPLFVSAARSGCQVVTPGATFTT